MEDKHSPRIPALVVRILSLFKTLVSTLAEDPIQASTAASHQARFKLWAGSLGAHRSAGYRSLEYRLRDSSFIRNHVASLLGDLSKSIGDGISVAVAGPIAGQETDESSMDVVAAELDDYFKSDGTPEPSEIDSILRSISHAINCLMRLSMAIRNPAPYDQFRSRAGAEVGYYQPWDVQHARDKFPDANIKTAELVGRAMTQRRMYFKYREEHSGRLARGLDSGTDVGGDGATTVASPVPQHLIDSPNDQTPPSNDMTVFNDALSDISGTSFAPSSSGRDRALEPPIPKGYSEGPVKCPFCHMIIQIDTLDAWRKHVFRDLRPYNCLVEDCLTPDHLYLRRREWIKHMELEHWRVWKCTLGCVSGTFPTASDFRNHLQSAHSQSTVMTNLETLVGLGSCLDPTKARGKCPLCVIYHVETSVDYGRHVGHHLEQLALFTIPNVPYDHDPDDEEEEQTRESEDDRGVEVEQDTAVPDTNGPEIPDSGAPASEENDASAPMPSQDGISQQPPASSRLSEYFVPGEGIDREVIAYGLRRYFGYEATVRPGDYKSPDGTITQGYYINAHQNLTTSMIEELKADSATLRWERSRAGLSQGQLAPPESYASARERWEYEAATSYPVLESDLDEIWINTSVNKPLTRPPAYASHPVIESDSENLGEQTSFGENYTLPQDTYGYSGFNSDDLWKQISLNKPPTQPSATAASCIAEPDSNDIWGETSFGGPPTQPSERTAPEDRNAVSEEAHHASARSSIPKQYGRVCARCRLRKNPCDRKLPRCGSCEKAGVACVLYDRVTRKEMPRSERVYPEKRVDPPQQMQNEAANEPTAAQPDPRTTRPAYMMDCTLCRLAKVHCDLKLPICGACEAGRVACVGWDPITNREIPRRDMIADSELQNELGRRSPPPHVGAQEVHREGPNDEDDGTFHGTPGLGDRPPGQVSDASSQGHGPGLP